MILSYYTDICKSALVAGQRKSIKLRLLLDLESPPPSGDKLKGTARYINKPSAIQNGYIQLFPLMYNIDMIVF